MIAHHLRLVVVVEYCKSHVGEVLTIDVAQSLFGEHKPSKSMIENTFNRALDIEGFSLFVDGLMYETKAMQEARYVRYRKEQLSIEFAKLTALDLEEKELREEFAKQCTLMESFRKAIHERIRKVM